MSVSQVLIQNPRKGLENDIIPPLLAPDAFPTLEDVFMFRGRIRRRRGVKFLGRIVSQVVNEAVGNANGASFMGTLGNTPIQPGSVSIVVGAITFIDTGNGTFTSSPAGSSGTINYLTGAISLTFVPPLGGATPVTATYSIFNLLPVMGLRTRELPTINEEQLIGFDTIKANAFISSATPPQFSDITFYKTTNLPFSWTGSDAQFFWSTNYQNAFWATNNVPGFQEFVVTNVTAAASAVITFTGGDVFQNGDIITLTNVIATAGSTLNVNGLTGTVTAHGAGTVTVTINTAAGFTYSSGGLIHSLTRTQSGDGIRWYDGTGWVNFQPPLSATLTGTNVNILQTALILLPYKGRLLALNTQEGVAGGVVTNFAQRARYSEIGTVYYNALTPQGFTGGFQADAWRDDIVGRGGFIDAPTSEQIISAEFIKDTLVVFFERSTYQLRYTGDPTIPFIWEKINTELGAESTFSIVPFDRGIYGVGNYGIITCDSVNVARIDQIIPDEVFNIHNTNNGVRRVHGIRDYTKQLVYWTFPNDVVFTNNVTTTKFPTRVLILNYLDGSYSFFNDSLTCFGQFQSFRDIRWTDLPIEWQNYPELWNSGSLQQDYPVIVTGNQQGYVFFFNQDQNASPVNDPSLSISAITQAVPAQITAVNHNLQDGQFIQITGVNGMTEINSNPLSINGIYRVLRIIDANNFTISYYSAAVDNFLPLDSTGFGVYTNGGQITVLNNFNVISKQFSPFLEEGLQARLIYTDIFVDGASNGQFSLNFYLNQENDTVVTSDISLPQTTTGQQRIWFRTIPNVTAEYIQFQMTLDNAQMIDPQFFDFDFILHAVRMSFQPSSRFMFGVQL
jgi:hypothetical protein